MASKEQLTSTGPSTRINPPRMGRVSSDRVKRPVPVIWAVALFTILPRKAPTLESVRESGSSGATSFTRASLAATTTALPMRLRSFWEKMSCSRPVVTARSTRAVRSWMYSSSGRVHSRSSAWSKASDRTSCLAASSSFRRSIWAADFRRSRRSAAARSPRARISPRSLSAWARAWAWRAAICPSVWAFMAAISRSASSWMRAVIFSIPSMGSPHQALMLMSISMEASRDKMA